MDGDSWIRAAKCGDLADGEALAVAAPDGGRFALFFADGGYHALDNQCPHMVFPLVRVWFATAWSPATGTTAASIWRATDG